MFQKQKSASTLNSEIDRILLLMSKKDPDSDIYNDYIERLSKLHALKVSEAKSRVSKDTWVMVGANLFGILLVLQHERTMIIPKTAMSFVQKLR